MTIVFRTGGSTFCSQANLSLEMAFCFTKVGCPIICPKYSKIGEFSSSTLLKNLSIELKHELFTPWQD
jgi:hypothetical protein